MSARRRRAPKAPMPTLEDARAGAQQRLAAFARRAAESGPGIDVGEVVIVFPARCTALDHAAIAWAHASGIPSPPNPATLGAALALTTTGLAYTTSPVPYVWWRAWSDIACSRAVAGRPRWRQGTEYVFASDRVPPFDGRAFELPIAAAKSLMDYAVQRGAVLPRAEP